MFLDSLHVATSRSFYQAVILARISKVAITKDVILVDRKRYIDLCDYSMEENWVPSGATKHTKSCH